MSRYFINAGWPYLYDVPGLHNCVPMLFADVYARFHRWAGDEVFFLCGGDEHGSRIEFMARGYGKEPRALVDEKAAATVPLLARMGISLDRFGRTTDAAHAAFVQRFLGRLLEQGRLVTKQVAVPYCAACAQHLPDRFVKGRCPHCGDPTFGGQCNNKKSCGRVIAALDGGACALCGGGVEMRGRPHLVFALAPYAERVVPRHGGADVARRVRETFRDVPEMALTRDTSWGTPLPGRTEPGQTVYSWVDSLLAKISFAPDGLWRDETTRKLFFLGMDGVPFYGALLPSLLLAAEDGYSTGAWTLLPNEVFLYEGGVCSKSTGTGIWLEEALAVLEPDLWRFHVYHTYASAEKDADFRWDRFADTANRWLVEGLSHAVERAAREPVPGDAASATLEQIAALLRAHDTGRAFLEVLGLVTGAGVSRATLLGAAPLLGCFLPDVAERMRRRLMDPGADRPLFEGGPISHRDVRARYEGLVARRRGGQSLAEEITNLRADALCVCPIDLKEQ